MRPILLGTTNPRSDDPCLALWPDPPGCAGWRLWKMIEAASGMSALEYVAAYDRRNLLLGEWKTCKGREAGFNFIKKLERFSMIVVLGQPVWRAPGLPQDKAPFPQMSVSIAGSTYFYLYHPSGRSRAYNDALERWRVGRFLADLADTAVP